MALCSLNPLSKRVRQQGIYREIRLGSALKGYAHLLNLINKKGVVQVGLERVLPEPAHGLAIAQIVSSDIDCGHNHSAMRPLVLCEPFAPDAVEARIDAAECPDIERFAGMLVLIFHESTHALPPVDIAIAEVAPGLRGPTQPSGT